MAAEMVAAAAAETEAAGWLLVRSSCALRVRPAWPQSKRQQAQASSSRNLRLRHRHELRRAHRPPTGLMQAAVVEELRVEAAEAAASLAVEAEQVVAAEATQVALVVASAQRAAQPLVVTVTVAAAEMELLECSSAPPKCSSARQQPACASGPRGRKQRVALACVMAIEWEGATAPTTATAYQAENHVRVRPRGLRAWPSALVVSYFPPAVALPPHLGMARRSSGLQGPWTSLQAPRRAGGPQEIHRRGQTAAAPPAADSQWAHKNEADGRQGESSMRRAGKEAGSTPSAPCKRPRRGSCSSLALRYVSSRRSASEASMSEEGGRGGVPVLCSRQVQYSSCLLVNAHQPSD